MQIIDLQRPKVTCSLQESTNWKDYSDIPLSKISNKRVRILNKKRRTHLAGSSSFKKIEELVISYI